MRVGFFIVILLLLAACGLGMAIIDKKRGLEQKRLAEENDMMYSAAINMLGYRFSREQFNSCITPFTNDEIDSLVLHIETSPNEEPGSKCIIHNIKKYPNRVFHINSLSLIQGNEPEVIEHGTGSTKKIPDNMIYNQQVLFLYTDFGYTETRLAASSGYTLYDERANRIIAYWWPMTS